MSKEIFSIEIRGELEKSSAIQFTKNKQKGCIRHRNRKQNRFRELFIDLCTQAKC